MFSIEKDERYIRMCNCPEIQNYRAAGFNDGDIIANYRREWIDVDMDTRKARRVFADIVVFDKITTIYDRDLIVWLPCQHDIQDMFGYGYGYDFKFLARQFAAYVDDCIEPEKFGSVLKTWCRSMHEFWLVFYMQEVHKKVWYGGEWKHIKHWTGMKWVNATPEKKK